MAKFKKKRVCIELCILSVFLISFVSAATIDRSITPDTANPGDSVSVDLNVNLDGGEQFYILKEEFPASWSMPDPDGGVVGTDGVWRITVNSPPLTNTHTYTLTVPDGANGPYSFLGDYGIVNGGSTSGIIAGENLLTISGPGSIMSVLPNTQSVIVGGNFNVDIYVNGGVNLFGVQFDLQFDDSILDVVSIVKDSELLGPNIIDSNDLANLDLQTGLINDFFIFRNKTEVGVSGSGKVATVTFNAHGPATGVVNLVLADTKFSDPNSNSLPHSIVSGNVDVGICGDGVIQSGLGEQCDDGKHCYDGTVCTLDSQCLGRGGEAGDDLCLTRDGDGCSAICTTDTCASQGGSICAVGDYCPGSILPSGDSNSCCSVACVPPAWATCGECGNGFFNLCDRAECQSITESCYFIDDGIINNNDIGSCTSCSGATCSDYNGDSLTCTGNICGIVPSCSFDGSSCDVATTETICSDAIDNDGDTLTDCADPDCASQLGPNGLTCCSVVNDCPNGECSVESCVANECTNIDRPAGDGTECGGCEACDIAGGSCIPITADEGNGCIGECTSCVAGSCDIRSSNDFTECTSSCNSCDGIGANCVPDTFTEGALCADPGKYCDNGVCCNDINSDNVCDQCQVDQECNDGKLCTTDTCSAGTCVYDNSGCDCATADINSDTSVDVLDLIEIVINDVDVTGDSLADILDLVFVASKMGVC